MMQKARLEYTDFSAGITENFVPGKENAYQRADNLLITRDKHLESRPGSRVLGDALYQLPTGYNRAASLIAYHNEENLFAISGKELFYVNSGNTWTTLKGPLGGSAFNSNLLTSQTNWAEWRKHLFLVPDGGDGPMMVYPDATGTFQLRQAGLPKPALSANPTVTARLNQAILLAISVKTQLAIHAADTVSHLVANSAVVTALNALTNPIDLPTLITFVAAVKTQYNIHLTDALAGASSQVFHIKISQPTAGTADNTIGRYSVLNLLANVVLAAPTDLNTTIAVLNDLQNRYNLHTFSTITHKDAVSQLSATDTFQGLSYATTSTGYGKNVVTLPQVTSNAFTFNGTTSYTPIFSGQLAQTLAYLNRIKKEFNQHIGEATTGTTFGSHNNADTDNTIVVPDATDYFSAYVLLAHLEFFYWWHYKDSTTDEAGNALIFQTFTGTATFANATIATASITGTSFTPALPSPPYYFLNLSAANPWVAWIQQTGFPAYAKVTGGSAGNVTFSAVSNGASGAGTWRIAQSKYHYDKDSTGVGALTSPIAYNARVQAFDYTYSSQASLMLAITYFLSLLKSHELSSWTKATVNGQPVYLMNSGQTSTLFATHYSNPISPASWPESQPGLVFVDKTTDAAYLDNKPLVGTVLYTFVWRYDYNVGTILFSDESTPAQESQLELTQSARAALPSTAAAYPTQLSNLPVLVNATGQNWDTTNIFLDIYRTITNGTSFFKVGSVTNGTTTFTDSVADIDLPSGEGLYTTGGVVANDQPPISKYITVLNSTAYYGAVTDVTSGEYFPNRILQSIPDDPKAAPTTFTDDLDDDLTGLGNFNSYVVAFCKTSVLRLDGKFDELGNGAIIHQEVSKTAGCISHKSIVATELGLFFCGTGGIFWTDAYKILKLTTELDKTYAAYTASPGQKTAVFSTYDKINRRVYFAFRSNPTTAECDVVWVLDLNWGMSEKMPFTTMSGGANFTPTALAFYQGQILRADAGGYVFKYDPTYKSDPLIDPTVAATSWLEQPVIWDFISCATNFGTSQAKKWVTRVTVQGKNRSNLSLAISAKNDDGKAGFQSLVPIRSRLNPRWGDYTIKWNDQPACFWKYNGMIDDFRRFPASTMRCDWKTIRMTNAFVIIANSDYADSTGYLTGGGD